MQEKVLLFYLARKFDKDHQVRKIRSTMGLTKKEAQDVRDSYVSAKRMPMHSKKDYRHNLHRNIVRMFSDIDDGR